MTRLLLERSARTSLAGFTLCTFPNYIREPAHDLICDHLDRVMAGEIKRLMIFAPPQHGKSELVSVRFPAYWLGRRPDDPIILTSYAAALATRKSQEARQVVESPVFRHLFGWETQHTSRAREYWRLQPPHRGRMIAAGVEGGITGEGALLGIIDDPHEGWLQAQSDAARHTVWAWYTGTFRPRIWEGGAIVIIMTRWHQGDLCGQLLADGQREWTVLRLPAVGEDQFERNKRNATVGLAAGLPDPLGRKPGEALCPRRYSVEALADLRRGVGSMPWEAEYMASPVSPQGTIIKTEWWKYYDEPPQRFDECLQSWDMAFKETADSSYVVGQVWGRLGADKYLLDQYRAQTDFPGTLLAFRQLTFKHKKAAAKLVEDAANGPAVIQSLQREIPGIIAVRPEGGKVARAVAACAQIESGNVFIPRRAFWTDAFVAECADFPTGVHDDQVDAMSQALVRFGAHPPVEAGVLSLR